MTGTPATPAVDQATKLDGLLTAADRLGAICYRDSRTTARIVVRRVDIMPRVMTQVMWSGARYHISGLDPGIELVVSVEP